MIKKFEKEKGIEWDERMPEEVIKDLKNLLGKENIYKISNPPGFITGDIAQKIKLKSDIVPLSNISNSTILHCNEVGVWETFESDKYGFNNPKEIAFNPLLISFKSLIPVDKMISSDKLVSKCTIVYCFSHRF